MSCDCQKLLICLLFVVIYFNFGVEAQSSLLRRCFFTPHHCPNRNVTFYLYTRENQNRGHQLDVGKPRTINRAKFIKDRPLIIIIHGYTGNKDSSPNSHIRPAFLKKGEFNVISVDYRNLAPEPCYPSAVNNLPTVANCTAQLLDYLMDNNFFPLELIHVIGFSLGKEQDFLEIENS